MRKLLWAGLLACFVTPMAANGQSAFDGTWKVDLSRAEFPKKPDVFLLEGEVDSCKSCVPTYEVNAHWQDQKVSGHRRFHVLSVKVGDDECVRETDRQRYDRGN